MNIQFDDKSRAALLNLVNNSSEDYIRIKAFRGCGKPAYEIFPSFKDEDDNEVTVDGVSFVYYKEDQKLIDGIEIKFDKEIYNNGFYIKSI